MITDITDYNDFEKQNEKFYEKLIIKFKWLERSIIGIIIIANQFGMPNNGGTPDFVGKMGDNIYVIELKKGKIRTKDIGQVMGYIYILRETGYIFVSSKRGRIKKIKSNNGWGIIIGTSISKIAKKFIVDHNLPIQFVRLDLRHLYRHYSYYVENGRLPKWEVPVKWLKVGIFITLKDFEKFLKPIRVDQPRGKNNRQLRVSKQRLCEHFNVSKVTLLKWMRENGYEDLIGKYKGKKSL